MILTERELIKDAALEMLYYMARETLAPRDMLDAWSNRIMFPEVATKQAKDTKEEKRKKSLERRRQLKDEWDPKVRSWVFAYLKPGMIVKFKGTRDNRPREVVDVLNSRVVGKKLDGRYCHTNHSPEKLSHIKLTSEKDGSRFVPIKKIISEGIYP